MHGEKLFTCLETLVEITYKIRDLIDESYFKNLGQLAYSKEFSTIRLGGPRRSGHSYAIIKFLLKNKGQKKILICGHSRAGLRIDQEIIQKELKLPYKPKWEEFGFRFECIRKLIIEPDMITEIDDYTGEKTIKPRPKLWDFVIVHPVAMYSQSCFDNIYAQTMCYKKIPIYIFMG